MSGHISAGGRESAQKVSTWAERNDLSALIAISQLFLDALAFNNCAAMISFCISLVPS